MHNPIGLAALTGDSLLDFAVIFAPLFVIIGHRTFLSSCVFIMLQARIAGFVAGQGDTTLPVFIFGRIRRGMKPDNNGIATLMIRVLVIIAALGLWRRSRKTD